MSNPTSVINFSDTVAQFLARTNQFGESNQDLIQQKFNKKQATGATSPVFAALESRSRAVAQWPNMVDDFILQFFTDQIATSGSGWQEVYRVDFRDVFTAQGAIDLNVAGNTFTFDGVTWETPSAARNGDAMVPAVGSFGITANGLEVVDATNARITPGLVTGNAVFASLNALGNNTSTPFDADPSREYLFQAYVSAENAVADHESSGVFIFREAQAQLMSNNLAGDGALYRAMYGFINSNGPRALEGTGGTGVSPSRLTMRPEGLTVPGVAPTVPMLWYANPQAYSFGGKEWDSANDDFPSFDNAHWFSTARDSSDIENDIVFHPEFGFFCGVGSVAENLNDTYDAVIQQYRILQR